MAPYCASIPPVPVAAAEACVSKRSKNCVSCFSILAWHYTVLYGLAVFIVAFKILFIQFGYHRDVWCLVELCLDPLGKTCVVCCFKHTGQRIRVSNATTIVKNKNINNRLVRHNSHLIFCILVRSRHMCPPLLVCQCIVPLHCAFHFLLSRGVGSRPTSSV